MTPISQASELRNNFGGSEVATVLLAIDACTRLEQLLPAAVLLASQERALLLGMFSQDARLLLGAALPFTFEVGANSAACYPVTTDSLTKRLQGIAVNMRRQLEVAAERKQLPWEFQMCYSSIGQITSETEADIVFPGWSTSLSAAMTHRRPQGKRDDAERVIAVVDDGSPSSAHAIETARRLATAAGNYQLAILSTSAASERSQTRFADGPGPQTEKILTPFTSMEQLIRQIRLLRPAIMLLGRDQKLAADSGLQKQLALIQCPLALLRSAS